MGASVYTYWFDNGTWFSGIDLPVAVHSHGSVAISETEIFICGGYTGLPPGSPVLACRMHDSTAQTYTTKASLPAETIHTAYSLVYKSNGEK